MKNRWIVFEGLDGSGKTTAIETAKNILESEGRKVFVSRAIGSGSLGPAIRENIFNGNIKDHMAPLALILNILDSHNELLEYLNKGYYVLSDRHIGSFYAYNCIAPDIRDDFEAHALSFTLFNYYFRDNRILKRDPDLTVFLDVDPNTCKNRLNKRMNEQGYTDSKSIDFFERLYYGYHRYLSNIKSKVYLLDNSGSVEDLKNDIKELLS